MGCRAGLPPGEAADRQVGATGPSTPELLSPEVTQAQAAYLLRNYQWVVDLLEPRLKEEPELPGGQRVLALALARLDREPEAIERLRAAARQSPTDWLARVSLAALLLRSPEMTSPAAVAAEAVMHLEAARAVAPVASTGLRGRRQGNCQLQTDNSQLQIDRPSPRPPVAAGAPSSSLQELLGAALWRAGQESLRLGMAAEAARQFAAAATNFGAAAEASPAARRELPGRQAAAFVGQAIALLLADRPEAAQRLFAGARIPGVRASDPMGRFAAGLFELCEELLRLPAADRAEAAAALRAVILETRLEVGLFDGRQAAGLTWRGGMG